MCFIRICWLDISHAYQMELVFVFPIYLIIRGLQYHEQCPYGKKNRLRQHDLVDYFGRDRLQLNDRLIKKVIGELKQLRKPWEELLEASFLSTVMKEKYLTVLDNRYERLFEHE